MVFAMDARVGLLFTLALRAFKWVFLVTEKWSTGQKSMSERIESVQLAEYMSLCGLL